LLVASDMPSSRVVRGEHPRPIFQRKEWLNLNGSSWQFAVLHEGAVGPPDEWEGNIVVPFCLQAPLSGALDALGSKRLRELKLTRPPLAAGLHQRQVLWYKRELTNLPLSWRSPSKRVLLHIGACDSSCTVFVNTTKVGSHEGGNTAFHFDITEALRSKGDMTIFVRCLDRPQDGNMLPCGKQISKPGAYKGEGPHVPTLYSNVSGIWQTVWLEAVPSRAHLQRVHIVPRRMNGSAWSLDLEPELPQHVDLADLTFEATLFERRTGCKEIVTRSSRITRFQNRKLTMRLKISAAAARVWCPEDPHLYGLRLRLYSKGEVIDEVQSYAALRTVECRGDQIVLNGEPRYMRLVLDQGYYPDGLWTAPTADALRRDIQLAQELGFNGARLHQKAFEPLYYSYADEMGFLVFAEYPDWNGGVNNRWQVSSEYMRVVTNEWPTLVADLHNHPSIIAWGLFNEFGPKGGWQHHCGAGGPFKCRYTPAKRKAIIKTQCDFVLKVKRKVKNKDRQQRPIHDSSGWIHVKSDLWSFHEYQQNAERFAAILADPPKKYIDGRSGQPLLVAEYGGVGLDLGGPYGNKNPAKFLAGYRQKSMGLPKNKPDALNRIAKLTRAIHEAPQNAGFCYTQLYDVEFEKNGILSYDRKQKFPLKAVQAIFDGRLQSGRWEAC